MLQNEKSPLMLKDAESGQITATTKRKTKTTHTHTKIPMNYFVSPAEYTKQIL